jgi:EmrB/QacA subfamily drug resistance transporter
VTPTSPAMRRRLTASRPSASPIASPAATTASRVNGSLLGVFAISQVARSGLEWVINAYILAFATLLLTGGRLADLYGRRRLFLTGLAVFTAASLFGGFATSQAELITARGLQGAGAALLTPTTLAIVAAAFPDLKERGKAIGIWAATSALAFAVGPVTGGVIAQHIHWSWIFWINVPVGLVGWLIARAVIDESRDETATQRIDLAGLAFSGATLFALVYALIEGNSHGWTSPVILGPLTIAAAGFAAFLRTERRATAPMLDLSLFRDRTFASANVLQLISGFGIFGVYFFLSLYVQDILGFSPTRAGLVFVPMALLITVVAPASTKVVERLGAAVTIGGGMLISAAGFLLLERLGQSASFAEVFPGLVFIGFGGGLTTPLVGAVLARVPVEQTGVASGVLNTMRELAASLGIAVTGAVLVAREGTAIAHGATHAAAFVDGYQIGLYTSAAVITAGALLALITLRRDTPAAEALAATPEPA